MIKMVKFSKKSIKKYLDQCIKYWRYKRNKENDQIAEYYIDAFQSIRNSIYGECLSNE